MPDAVDLNQSLETSAAGPSSITIDGQTSTEHSLRDQIDVANRKAATRAKTRPGFGLAFAKMVPHGAVQ